MKQILLSLLLVLVFGFAYAQAQTITGKVTDATNQEGVPGVSVVVKGTTTGTITDSNGTYSLSAPSGSTLVFQLLGYKSQEIVLASQSVIDIALQSDASTLDDVVVVAYGTQQKRDITGSIASVKGSDIQNIPVPSLESAIQGRAAGVQITSGSGKVGQGINVRVRGSASLSANNQPLYVIDGIIVTANSVNANDENLNPMADINPNDIESIEVLKDAAASALYGARASNGVVLITTKKGKAGKGSVNINYSAGSGRPTRKREFLNRAEYIELYTEGMKNVGRSDAFIESRFNNRVSTTWKDPNIDTNWENLAFQNAGFQQLDINASGGNEKTRFFVGAGYIDQKGILVGNRFTRMSARLNADSKINDRLTVGASFMLAQSKNYRAQNDASFGNPLQLVAMPPMQQAYKDGELNPSTLYYNSLLDLVHGFSTAKTYRNLTSLFASYNVMKNLTFRSEVGLDILQQVEERYYGTKTAANFSQAAKGFGSYSTATIFNYMITNTLNYTKNFNDIHNVDILLGQSFQQSEEESSNVDGQIFALDDFKKIGSAATFPGGSSGGTSNNFLSYFARANYKFKDKYLASFSLRVDGSSRFGKNSRYGLFPAGSLGWIISEEDFIKDLDFISFLKLRTSFGITGNADFGDFGSFGLYGTSVYLDNAGTTPISFPNPSLGWESTQNFDMGIEIGIIKNRVNLGIDYYNKQTSDLLLNVPVPSTSGYTTLSQNIGKIRNRGIEVTINSNNLVGDFKWNTSFNIAFNRNKVLDMAGQKISYGGRTLNEAQAGQPIGILFGAKYAGVDPANGDALYYTETGTTKDYNAAFRQIIGDPNPDFIGGITNTLTYKGFDLNIFFQYVYGNDVYNAAGEFMSSNARYLDNQTKDQLNRWRKPGDITNVPQARHQRDNGSNPSSRFVYDASYLRLKTATLGYNVPKKLLDNAKLASVRIYVSGQNLLTFTKYIGWDPEVSSADPGSTTQRANIIIGQDFYTPPQARTIIFGINVGF